MLNTRSHTMSNQVDLLYEEYKKSRKISLNREQFSYLTKLYPALLVCMSDGVLDEEEWELSFVICWITLINGKRNF